MLKRSSLFTEGARLCGEDWIFQQDNAAIHTTRRSKNIFWANDIVFFSSSLNLNPFENLWGWIERGVYKNGTQFETVCFPPSFVHLLVNNLLQTLVLSMPQRNFGVINKNGAGLHYWIFFSLFTQFLAISSPSVLQFWAGKKWLPFLEYVCFVN